ncbi:hypothetical protein OG749_05315 [Streptomyces nojiriensis]|uniref:hypothetical protein n=1 Tax=Streptomyces nojiriensis TaxID=66374 RepID=UPI002E19D2E8
MIMTMPGFTAEASAYRTSGRYSMARQGHTTDTQIVPMGKLTCEQGSEAICEEYCMKEAGGMSSNPDGTTSCSF